jgi:ribosomal protein S8
MSLRNLADLCSKLQNASRSRLGVSSFYLTKSHLSSFLAMQRQGLVQRVTVAGALPPAEFQVDPESVAELADTLKSSPWDAYPNPEEKDLPDREESILPPNPAERKIWVQLKYYNGLPVIRNAKLISSPNRQVTLSIRDIAHLLRGQKAAQGRRANQIKPLVNPGETMYLKTSQGILEAREALAKKLGGRALFRLD